MALDIRHILPDGEVEVQRATERRLLERAGRAELPLFQNAAATENEEPPGAHLRCMVEAGSLIL